jgi:hypothetical protein
VVLRAEGAHWGGSKERIVHPLCIARRAMSDNKRHLSVVVYYDDPNYLDLTSDGLELPPSSA